jgi:hypothetical protein
LEAPPLESISSMSLYSPDDICHSIQRHSQTPLLQNETESMCDFLI